MASRTCLLARAITAGMLLAVPIATRADDTVAALPPAQDESAASRGSSLWTYSGCAACHVGTVDMEPVKELGGLSRRYSVFGLADYLRAPRSPMPTFPLTEADRESLAVYLLQTHP